MFQKYEGYNAMHNDNAEVETGEPTIFRRDIDRRTFLKASGVTAGAVAVTYNVGPKTLRNLTVLPQEAALATVAGETLVPTFCRPNCFNGCRVYAHVRDGKVVKTSMAPLPEEIYNRICLRGLTNPQQMYSDRRIKYPMKRAGARGEGKWERISWEEAAKTITDEWKRIREAYGKQALAFFQASGNIALLHGIMPGATARLANMLEGTTLDASLDAAMTVGINRVVGNAGPWVSSEPKDYVNAKTMIAWGANVTDAQPQSWHFVADALEKGVKLIVVDPVYTILASKANKFVDIRPGTDTALTLSMMNVILEEKLHDVPFLLKHTVAPFLVRDDTRVFLRMSDLGVEPQEGPADAMGNPTTVDPIAVWDSVAKRAGAIDAVDAPALEGSFEVNGIKVHTAFELLKEEIAKWPPEVASKTTDVDPETIRYLARVAADKPVTHIIGWGPQAYDNGVHTAHASATLCALTGNAGFPGASFGGNWNLYPGINWAFTMPTGTATNSISHLVYRKSIATGTHMGKPYPVKALYVNSGNPANTAVHGNEWINVVVPSLDLIVVADTVMTDTARYADIVLPVAGWFEQEDITSAGQTHYIEHNEKAIEPLFESKPDADIIRLLAEGMGWGEYFTKTNEEMLEELLDTPFSKGIGVTLQSLREKGMFRYMPDPYIAWEGQKFATPSGRMEFYVENPSRRSPNDIEMDMDRERLPRFFPPTEAWHENPLAEKYPLILLSTRPKFRVHSQWSTIPWLRELDPEPDVRINVKDAEARGIKNGDYVEVFNERGRAVVKAVLTQGIRPGVMVFAKGWNSNQYIEGDLATLSSSSFDPVGVNSSFMDELAEVRKWNGKA